MAKLPSNFNSWKYTAKVIRQIHNTDVSRHFSDIKNDDDLSRGRSGLKAGLIIRAKDSALEILNKQIMFRLGIQQNSSSSGGVASFPMSWVLKPGDEIPQLAIVYRLKEKDSGYNTIYIPHYSGDKNPVVPSFQKGIYGTILEMKDNSRIVIFAQSHEVGRDYILKRLVPMIKPQFKQGYILKQMVRKNVRAGLAVPVRADFYPNGKASGGEPLWRHYF